MEGNRKQVNNRTQKQIATSEGLIIMKNKWSFVVSVASACGLVAFSNFEARADSNPLVVPTMQALRALSVTVLTNDTLALMVDYYQPSEMVSIYGGGTRGRGGGFFRWRTNFIESPIPADDG